MKPTPADLHYRTGTLRRPTKLDNLYPDPFGHLDQLEEARVDRIASRIVTVLTVIVALATAGFMWRAYQWIAG